MPLKNRYEERVKSLSEVKVGEYYLQCMPFVGGGIAKLIKVISPPIEKIVIAKIPVIKGTIVRVKVFRNAKFPSGEKNSVFLESVSVLPSTSGFHDIPGEKEPQRWAIYNEANYWLRLGKFYFPFWSYLARYRKIVEKANKIAREEDCVLDFSNKFPP